MKPLTLTLILALGACAAQPEILDTHTGEWEEACIPSLGECLPDERACTLPNGKCLPAETHSPEGWQCDGTPCTEEQLEDLVELLEQMEQIQ